MTIDFPPKGLYLVPRKEQVLPGDFGGTSRWLTETITPKSYEVQTLYAQLTRGLTSTEAKISACHGWVLRNILHRNIRATLFLDELAEDGTVAKSNKYTPDAYWTPPAIMLKTREGPCLGRALLLSSLLRNVFSDREAFCVSGFNPFPYSDPFKPGFDPYHFWTEVYLRGKAYIVDAYDQSPMIPVTDELAHTFRTVNWLNYQKVTLFNDAYVLGSIEWRDKENRLRNRGMTFHQVVTKVCQENLESLKTKDGG